MSGAIAAEGIVSVVVPSFNSSKTLGLTLRSVLEQDRGLVREITVVDSSDDGSLGALKALYEPEGVRFITSGVRVMPAVQRNIGAAASNGRILLFLDSDVILSPGYVRTVLAYCERGYRVGFGAVTLPPFQARSRLAVAQYYLQLNEFLPAGGDRILPYLIGCNNFCEKPLFDEIGGYPEMRAAEDVGFGLNVSKAAPIVFIPSATVAHVFREDADSFVRNQKMLGRYVSRYRRERTGSRIYFGAAAFLLSPLFYALKALRLFARVAKAGPSHLRACLRVLPLVLSGLCSWMSGFLDEARDARSPAR